MKAIIRCGGEGKRLRPLTYFVPKPMIKVAGKPILEHIIDYLKYYGIEQIVVNVRYKPSKIMKHFGDRILYLYDKKPTTEEETIKSLEKWRAFDYCAVINGDTLTNLNLLNMMSMSNGENIKFMDGKTYAGVRIVEPNYVEGDKSCLYQNKDFWWIDVGTFKGLRKARKLYEKEFSALPKL
jgi:dTDP-glucose pyrophosphorylase